MNDQKKRPTMKSLLGLRPVMLLVVLAALLTATSTLAYTPPNASELEASEASFLMRDGVVVDPARGSIYVMQDDGLAAYGTDGTPLWKSDQAARPVGLFGDQLIALATSEAPHSARVVLLTVSGGDVVATITAALPAPAGGWVVDRPHQSFDAKAIIAGGQAHLAWRFTGRPLSGARAVVAGQPQGGLTQLEGTLRLDPAAGRAVAVGASEVPQAPTQRFDLAPEERLEGVAGRQFRAGDGRHVLASDKLSATDEWNRYRWTLVDRGTGSVRGIVDRPVSTAAFFVVGNTLIHEANPHLRRLGTGSPEGNFELEGTRLVAVDLGSGHDLWTIDLRDTVYRGTMPP